MNKEKNILDCRIFWSIFILGIICFTSCEKGPDFRTFNYPAPVVNDFSPKQGYIGSNVTITGSNFGDRPGAIKVYFGGVIADSVLSVTGNEILVQAPPEGVDGIISVEYFGKIDTTAEAFTYMPSAKFTAVSTDKALEGDEVTVTGENFGTNVNKVQIFIGDSEAQVVSVTPTEIKFSVSDVPSGTVFIVVDGQRLTGSYLMVGIEKLAGVLFGHSGSWNNDPATTIAAGVDGDINTFVDAATSSGYLGYDLGNGKAAILKSVRYVPRATYASRMLDAEIRGANDPSLSDYVTLYKITEAPLEGVYTEKDITTDEDESYRYIYYYAPSGNCDIAEIEFYGNIIEKENPPGKYVWEFAQDGDNEGWEAQQSGQWTVSGGSLNVTFTQTSGNKRADLAFKRLPIMINTGTYPIIAIKMTRPESARVTFDTNLGAFGNSYNKYSTDFATQDIYYWDMSATGFGTGAPRPDEQISFTTFQFKIADIPQTDPATGYKIDWIRTFQSKDELSSFLAP